MTINRVRKQIQWKPDSAMVHLQKRKRRGHLSETAVLADYERIILQVLESAFVVERPELYQAKQFYEAIQEIADLANWRQQQNVPATHWWWYLDTIIQLPSRLEKSSRQITTASQFTPV